MSNSVGKNCLHEKYIYDPSHSKRVGTAQDQETASLGSRPSIATNRGVT